MGSILDQERTDVCKQELDVVETYTNCNHNQQTSYVITTSTTIFYIFIHICNNLNQNCTTDIKSNVCLL